MRISEWSSDVCSSDLFLSRRFPGNSETERIHDVMCQQIDDVLARAQEAGKARPDITRGDVVNLIWANGRIIDATSAEAPAAWRRQLYLMLDARSEEHTSELQSLMRISYAVFCLKKKNKGHNHTNKPNTPE